MCGICGIYNHGAPKRQADQDLVKQMMGAMASRGPDDQGDHFEDGLGLGFRRLAIVDLSPAGHQPMEDESGTLRLVLNGEIYNAPALRRELETGGHRFRSHSDAEVVLHLYQELGCGLLNRLEGMFAFALWDPGQTRLLLARDRMGVKPLYYFADQNHFAFASSFRSLLCDPAIAREVDAIALNDFLALRYVPAPATLIRGVKKLEPGHRLVVTPGNMAVARYWDIPLNGPRRPFPEARADLAPALDAAVASHLMSDVPVAAFLSGGVDSSIVVGAMVKAGARPETFSAGFGDDPEFTELAYAKLVADHWGLKNHQVLVGPAEFERSLPEVVRALEEPIADPAAVPGYYLSQAAAHGFKVVLTGEGADETFGGYKRYCWANRREGWLAPLSGLGSGPSWLAERMGLGYFRQRTAQLLTVPEASQAYLENVSLFSSSERRDIMGPVVRGAGGGHLPGQPARAFARASAASLSERLMYADSKYWLADDLLIKMDKVSMAHSLEARVPLLDRRLVELAWRVDPRWKYRGRVSKHMLREIGKEYLPPAVFERPKHGFDLPIRDWFRGRLSSYVSDIVLDRRWLQRGFVERDEVERLWREHHRGRRDNSFQLFGLLTLALWEKEWL